VFYRRTLATRLSEAVPGMSVKALGNRAEQERRKARVHEHKQNNYKLHQKAVWVKESARLHFDARKVSDLGPFPFPPQTPPPGFSDVPADYSSSSSSSSSAPQPWDLDEGLTGRQIIKLNLLKNSRLNTHCLYYGGKGVACVEVNENCLKLLL
jgi:hypothetical protein